MEKRCIVPDALKSNYTDWHFSPAVVCGDFVLFSGCTGSMPNEPIPPAITDQSRNAFRKIEMSLIESGLNFSDVVEMTTYHVGLREHLEEFKGVKDEFIKEPYPAWTAIGVSELAVEGALIEVRVIAKIRNNG